MISVAILGLAVLGLVSSLGLIQRSIQGSKSSTLASNLAQEKMQILKQKSYYQVLVTTDPAYNTNFSPNIPYDTGYFPPETILEGGISFQRLTYIQVAQEVSGVVTTLAPTTPDTGLRRVTVSVVWTEGGQRRKLQLLSLLANPDTVMTSAAFSGTVRSAAAGNPVINGALVNIAENTGWRDTTNASGVYSIGLSPGNFTMLASAHGYFPELRLVSIAANQGLTQDFTLTPMSSGTVQGTVWYNDHLVLSQIVGSTVDATGYSQEYVELFNPTTYAWTVSGQIGLRFQRPADSSKKNILISYGSGSVAPGGFYLFANTGTVTAAGQSVAADAVWSPLNSSSDFPYFGTQMNIIPTSNQSNEGGGALELYRVSDDQVLDRMGWDRNNGSQTAPFAETEGLDENIGLELREQYVRFSSTAGFSTVYGPAYDSGNNNVDWDRNNPLSIPPRNSATAPQAVIAGVPAVGAVVSGTDGLSVSTAAHSIGSPPRADFALTQVATGTWLVVLSSGSYQLENATVTIAASGSTYDFPSSTTFLNEANTEAFISGRVTKSDLTAISPAIAVSPGGAGANTNASATTGRYLLRVLPGTVDVTANPNNANASYVYQSSQGISIALGEVHSGVDFILSQGGRLQGFITRDGINALPGVAVAALDSGGISRDQQVSGSDGRFTMVNLATGTYTIQPVLGSSESSSPDSSTKTVLSGQTVFSTTFTITGALGTIQGSVTAGGQPLRTGVLVVVTTTTLSGSPPAPPALSSATLTATPYYLASSGEDGSYSVDVRQSTNPAYRVYAYYTTFNGSTVVINASSLSSVQVLAGQTVTGQNFAW